MRRVLRSLSLVALACLPWGFGPAAAKPVDCWRSSLDHLRAASPDGFAIYKQVSDPDFFKGWIRCDDPQFDLSTAVHESTHFVTSETDAFPLVGGGAIQLPHEVSTFFPPSRIGNRFGADDFTTIYLRRGKASSATDFLYLLDELNAYSHDLNTAVALKDLKSADVSVDHRDGLAALMAFVATYAEVAQQSDAKTWNGLRQPRAAHTIAVLWGRAERVMSSSCGIPNFGTLDKAYIRRFCAAKARAALEPILGRAPVCPTACLKPTRDIEAGETVSDSAAGTRTRRSTAGPSWITTIIQSKAMSRDTEPEEAGAGDAAR